MAVETVTYEPCCISQTAECRPSSCLSASSKRLVSMKSFHGSLRLRQTQLFGFSHFPALSPPPLLDHHLKTRPNWALCFWKCQLPPPPPPPPPFPSCSCCLFSVCCAVQPATLLAYLRYCFFVVPCRMASMGIGASVKSCACSGLATYHIVANTRQGYATTQVGG